MPVVADADVSWTLQGSQWRIRPQGGQLSYLDGQIVLISADQTLSAEQAWLWRSEDGGVDKICKFCPHVTLQKLTKCDKKSTN